MNYFHNHKILFTRLALGVFFFVVVAGLSVHFNTQKTAITSMRIHDREIHVEVASTDAAHEVGLAKFTAIPDDFGMLFVFKKPDIYSFWMKNMHFPIDIIWLDEYGTVVSIASRVAPETYPKIFTPDAQALYVLEVNAGFAEKNNLRVGDKTEFLY